MPIFGKKVRPVFRSGIGQHLHREGLDLVVGEHLEIRDLGRVDSALAKSLRDTFGEVLNPIAKYLRSKHLHRTEASDGGAILLSESGQRLLSDQSSEDRTKPPLDVRQRFFEA